MVFALNGVGAFQASRYRSNPTFFGVVQRFSSELIAAPMCGGGTEGVGNGDGVGRVDGVGRADGVGKGSPTRRVRGASGLRRERRVEAIERGARASGGC